MSLAQKKRGRGGENFFALVDMSKCAGINMMDQLRSFRDRNSFKYSLFSVYMSAVIRYDGGCPVKLRSTHYELLEMAGLILAHYPFRATQCFT